MDILSLHINGIQPSLVTSIACKVQGKTLRTDLNYSFPRIHFNTERSVGETVSSSPLDKESWKIFNFSTFMRKHAQSCLSLCDPMDCSPPGSSVHGIFPARILEWVVIFSSRRSSQPSDQTQVSCISCIGRQILYHYATFTLAPQTDEVWEPL